MLPEELIDIPEDLSTSWLCVPQPLGKRCLVVSAYGKTQCFLRNGTLLESFSSLLPSGGSKQFKPKEECILDCILDPIKSTLYVLDILCWRGFSVEDFPTEFRFYWIFSKLSEEDESLDKVSSANPYKLEALPRYECNVDGLKAATSVSQYTLQGFLFYHKEASYTREETPLMCFVSKDKIQSVLSLYQV